MLGKVSWVCHGNGIGLSGIPEVFTQRNIWGGGGGGGGKGRSGVYANNIEIIYIYNIYNISICIF